MVEFFQSPAQATYWKVSGQTLFFILHFLGLACFSYIVAKRMAPLMRGARDLRFDQPWVRLGRVVQFWLGQWKHPRFRFAGIIHIVIFTGFIILITRAGSLLLLGITDKFATSGSPGGFGHIYDTMKDYAATLVLLAVIIAAIRRIDLQTETVRGAG